ncbi:MAG TPA: capsule biosynthesis protein [Fibrobacteres bacterium]|nr:capsule biosynthesis protein [Fibrobacterota bacterium]
MNNILSRAREILEAESDAIKKIPLDNNFTKAIDILYKCKGKIITTGMGKAGNIALKTAGTLCSTGSPACFLHPGESAHGDLGLLDSRDVILAFSTSGKTRDVIEMLERAKHLGVEKIICITSHPDSPIRDLCNVIIDMGQITEPCSLGLTPTASTTVMMAIGDTLSLILMEKNKFTKAQFGIRHHGGYLGHKARERQC